MKQLLLIFCMTMSLLLGVQNRTPTPVEAGS